MMKGRARVATGGSTKGTTVAWGDYGLRMVDHQRRVSAKNLKIAEDAIKLRLRGEKYRLYKRVCCNIGVFTSGNEVCSPTREGVESKNCFANSWGRCVWVRERVASTTGLRELQLTRSCWS